MSTQHATFNHLFMYTKILNNYIKVSLGSLLPSTEKKCYKNLSKASEFGQHLPRIINWKDVNSSFILVIILVSLLPFEPNAFCSMCLRGWGCTPLYISSFRYRMVLKFIPGKPVVKSWQWMTPLNVSHDWYLIYRPDTNFSWYPQKRKIMWTINFFYQRDLFIKFLAWETTKLF